MNTLGCSVLCVCILIYIYIYNLKHMLCFIFLHLSFAKVVKALQKPRLEAFNPQKKSLTFVEWMCDTFQRFLLSAVRGLFLTCFSTPNPGTIVNWRWLRVFPPFWMLPVNGNPNVWLVFILLFVKWAFWWSIHHVCWSNAHFFTVNFSLHALVWCDGYI